MELVPAIDLLDGRAVVLTGGRPDSAEVQPLDPASWARRWEGAGARRLHVVDLDRALGRGENARWLDRIVSAARIPVQVGGGLRTTDDVEAVLARPRTSAIVGSRAFDDPDWFAERARAHPGRLILAVDRDERGIVVDGWRRRVPGPVGRWVDWANGLPLEAVLFTDVAREGRLAGVAPRPSPITARCAHPSIAAGGIASTDDLDRLAGWGYARAVVGKALYSDRVPFQPAWGADR